MLEQHCFVDQRSRTTDAARSPRVRISNHFRLTIWLLVAVIVPTITGRTLAADDKALRVMSFNIRYGTAADGENHWKRRKDFVVETIENFNPDLLGTQETIGFQKDYLQQHLPEYASIGVGREDGGSKGEMTAIFYRQDRFEHLDAGHFWLSESPDQPGSQSWDSSLPRMCSWVRLNDRRNPGRPILFINTHFDHRGSQARLESARLLRSKAQELGDRCDVVITGDFNAAVGSEPYQAMFDEKHPKNALALIDTYKVAAAEDEPGEGTFSGFRAGVNDGARIDWVAVSKGWKVVSASIDRTSRDGRTPSDHYPVTATLQRD